MCLVESELSCDFWHKRRWELSWGKESTQQSTTAQRGRARVQPPLPPTMPYCWEPFKGHGCRSNFFILFPLAAEHSVSQHAWLEVGIVSRHLDSLTWHRESLSGGWLLQESVMVWSFSPVASPEMGEKAFCSSMTPGSLCGQWAGEGVPERMVLLVSILRLHPVAPQMWEVSALLGPVATIP